MKYTELTKILKHTMLFDDNEINRIVKTCGVASISNAIIACEVIGIELIGNDIDIIIQAAQI